MQNLHASTHTPRASHFSQQQASQMLALGRKTKHPARKNNTPPRVPHLGISVTQPLRTDNAISRRTCCWVLGCAWPRATLSGRYGLRGVMYTTRASSTNGEKLNGRKVAVDVRLLTPQHRKGIRHIIVCQLPDIYIRIRVLDQNHPEFNYLSTCLLYTSPSPRDLSTSRMPSSA